MKTKISILFYAKRAKITTDGLLPVYLRVTIEGKRIEVTTKRYVESTKWCAKAGRLKGGSEDIRTINKYLDQLKNDVYNHENDLRSENKDVNYDNLKSKILGTEVKARMLVTIFQRHNDDVKTLLGTEFALGTLERYKTSLKHTVDFLKWKFNISDIDIKKINHEFITDFDFYLRSVRKCQNNSTVKYIKNFGKIIRICIANGWLDKNPFAAMIDSTGNLLWQKTYGGTQEEQANSIEKTIDGGFILSGYTESNDGDVTNFIGNSDAWVVKIDSIGNIQWQKCLGGTLIDKGYKVVQSTSGDYVLSCMSFSNNTFVHDHISAYDSWVVKLDPLGDTIWTKSYGGNGDDSGMDIQQTSSGGFILGSTSNSTSTGVSGNHGMNDYWACKIDPSGSIEWEKCYGGNSIEYLQALRQTTDGGFILIGQTLSSANGDVSINKGSYDLFIVKLNNENGLSVNNQELNVRVLVFPNPTNSVITLSGVEGPVTIEIFNILGSRINSLSFGEGKGGVQIDLSKETNGIYFMKIITDKGTITKRIIKQ